jgi:hypothetical protein
VSISNDIKQVIDIVKSKEPRETVKINKLNKIFRRDPKLANQIELIINKYAAAEFARSQK